MFPKVVEATVVHSHVRDRKSFQPSRRSAMNECDSDGHVGGHRDGGQERRADGERGGVDGERPARPDAHHEHARERRPGDPAPGLGQAAQRVGLLEALRADDGGHDPGDRGVEERARGAGDRREGGDRPDARLAGDQQRRHQAVRGEPDDVGGHHQRAPRQPVGPHAADEQERDERDRPRREHDAEVARRARQVEHREGERDADHAVAQQRDALADEQEPERALAQRVEAAVHQRTALRTASATSARGVSDSS